MKTPSVIKKTSESEVKLDKNGKEYKTCGFTKLTQTYLDIPGVGLVAVHQQAKETRINLYAENYLNMEEDHGYRQRVGEFLMGDIVTRDVIPYTINDVNDVTGDVTSREVSTFSTVVFGNDTDASWEGHVRNTFRSKNHPLLTKTEAPEAMTSIEAPNGDILA